MTHSLSIWCCVEFLLCNKCCWNYKSAWRTSPCAVSRNSSLVVHWTNMQLSLNYSVCYLLLTEWDMCHIRVVFQGLYKLEGLKVVVVAELAHPLWWVSLIYSLMRAPPSGRASRWWGYRSQWCVFVYVVLQIWLYFHVLSVFFDLGLYAIYQSWINMLDF